MMRECGKERRWPGSPAHSSREAIDAAWPTHSVLTGFRMYCAAPRRTQPPAWLPKRSEEAVYVQQERPPHLHGVVDGQPGRDHASL